VDGDLPQRERLGSAELVDIARGVVVAEAGDEGGNDVADPHGGQPDFRPGEGQDLWNALQQPGQARRERVVPAEDQRGLEDRPAQVRAALVADDPLALALGAEVVARTVIRIRVERAHVQETVDPCLPAGRHELARQFRVDPPEPLAPAPRSIQDAHQVDHGVVAGDDLAELHRVVNVAADPAYRGHHPEVPGPGDTSRGDGHLPAGSRERGAQLGADETGSAQDADASRPHSRDYRQGG